MTDVPAGAPATLPRRPATTGELAQIMAAATQAGSQIQLIGSHSMPVAPADAGRAVQPITTVRMNAILGESNTTISVQAGITLDALQRHLAFRGRWIPLDPPAANSRLPMQRTLGGIIATDSLGPLGLAYPWEALIAGITWVDFGGEIHTTGDATAMIHSLGRAGAVAEVTLRTHPTPPDERAAIFYCPTAEAAQSLLAASLALAPGPAYVEVIGGQSLARNILDLPLPPAGYQVVVVGYLGESDFCEGEISRVRQIPPARETESLSLTAAQAGRLRLWMTREPNAPVVFRIRVATGEVCRVIDRLEGLNPRPHFLVSEARRSYIRGGVEGRQNEAQRSLSEVCGGVRQGVFETFVPPQGGL